MAVNNEAHQALTKATKFRITKEFPRTFRLFDRTVGVFYAKRVNGNVIDYQHVTIGKRGQCDQWGVISCGIKAWGNESPILPIHVELEMKTGSGKLNEDQETWKAFCIQMGWLWFQVREDTDVVKEIKDKIESMGLFIWF